ncbi:MAG: retinol dehydrogenase-12, partial [Myxococcota bacterium]
MSTQKSKQSTGSKKSSKKASPKAPTPHSVALVTGANGGIGLETAVGIASRGGIVVMAARNRQKGLAAMEIVKERSGNDKVELLELDLASLTSVRKAAATFLATHDRLDLLVNNAGVMLTKREVTEDGFEATFGVNHLGHFLFTHLLLDTLKATDSARIINVSSAGHRMTLGLKFDDLMYSRRRYNGVRAYCDSKLANVLFTTELARRLEGTGVVVHALHPGVVRTHFAGDGDTQGLIAIGLKLTRGFYLSPADGAKTSLHAALSDEAGGMTGKYWAKSKLRRPRLPKNEAKQAARLWTLSAELVGLSATA